MEDEREFSSLRLKLKSTICFTCCFSRHHEALHSSSSSLSLSPKPKLARSSTWLKSTARDLPEIKEKCRNMISRIGRSQQHRNHRRGSVEFRYDPLSYALNFDEGFDCDGDDVEFPLRNFSARLPAERSAVPVQRQVVCV